ncbi:NfeD family protein [Pelotalea chapellei]|uniref:NfeD family protein n=1 Tax=Pelotalea chapellei TaxID=44671 RepID=A0ABS5U5V4_9BACT|nr:NfeD family protein [Pelotalea chapellei]MBT1071050.1 NfeD family protein [Pelotalea chapellei]
MQLEWWYWIIAGFCLIGLELIVPSFTIIWFGMGALVVGVLVLVWSGFPVAGQILLWSVASIVFTLMWFKYLRPEKNRTHAGMSKEGIVGETGIIIRGTDDSYGKGTVRFRISVLGADEWSCYSEQILQVGDSVRVVDIEGQMLKVVKI